MRYYIDNNTLFIRGSFRAASSGISTDIRNVSTILNHTAPLGVNHGDPEKELGFVAAAAGITGNFFGLMSSVPLSGLCVLQYDFVTVFIIAGIRNVTSDTDSHVNIIICSGEGLADAALLQMIIVATDAKAEVLKEKGFSITGTPADAVIVASEGKEKHRYASRVRGIGKRVHDAILYGLPEALHRHEGIVRQSRPSFFIFSRFKGDHWTEWHPEDCPYYPCHFAGQRCDFCYCPLYPCSDESLGQWVERANGGKVWNCSHCTLLHEPDIAEYLLHYPDASKEELVRLRNTKKNDETGH